jgi:hypothetical protein
MRRTSEIRRYLYDLASRWEEDARGDSRDYYPFSSLLDEVFFHADIRYSDYVQFQNAGSFSARLKKWIGNVSEDRHKKALFQLLAHKNEGRL